MVGGDRFFARHKRLISKSSPNINIIVDKNTGSFCASYLVAIDIDGYTSISTYLVQHTLISNTNTL